MRPAALYGLFFFSGFPALIYQLIWQRALFSAFGVNIESITIVVTVFILGLGLGGLFGGFLSRVVANHLLALFAFLEICVGLLGLRSLDLIELVNRTAAGASLAETCFWTFLVLLPPTVMMGATLPVLVQHLVRRSANVGGSFGGLYAANTLGSAAACFLSAILLFDLAGQFGSIVFAATLNLATGAGALIASFVSYKTPDVDPEQTVKAADYFLTEHLISPVTTLFTVAVVGFVSLSWEIVWIRAFNFVSSGTSASVVLLLGSYLVGLGIGAAAGQRICLIFPAGMQNRRSVLTAIGAGIIVTSLASYLVVPVTAVSAGQVDYWWSLPLVSLSTLMFGALLPIICHVSTRPDDATGLHVGTIYFVNVIGAASGSFLTGFVLLDLLSLQDIVLGLVIAGLAAAAFVGLPGQRTRVRVVSLIVAAIGLWQVTPSIYSDHYERMLRKSGFEEGYKFQHLVENRSGVITVTPGGRVYGGGAYDGVFNVDPVKDKNGIFRAYAVGLIHPSPKKVLMIGLASGSWAQVIAHNPTVEELVIVEINPGYVDLVEKNPVVASLLKNSKVRIVADDGKRWLTGHAGEKFDLIVMNTIHHWRAHSTHLLSQTFMALARKHLNKGGVLYYNSTRSKRVQKTGAEYFPYAIKIAGIVAVSDSPIVPDKIRWTDLLRKYRIDGKPVFDSSSKRHIKRFAELVSLPDSLLSDNPGRYDMARRDVILRKAGKARVVTKDNMGHEWSRF